MKTLLLILALALAPLSFTGCVTPRTTEAVVFDSFRTTYNAAYSAYTGYLELVVAGKVSKIQEEKVDNAWNNFRAGFSIALQAASNDWNTASPEQVRLLANRLLQLIRTI